MDRFLTCAMGFGVLVFAGCLCFVECSKTQPDLFEDNMKSADMRGRGEFYIDAQGRERFRLYPGESFVTPPR